MPTLGENGVPLAAFDDAVVMVAFVLVMHELDRSRYCVTESSSQLVLVGSGGR